MKGQIPGNLLLFGEYAVTEEKGLGISAAVYPTVRYQYGKGDIWTGKQGKDTWNLNTIKDLSGSQETNNLLYYCLKSCRKLAEKYQKKFNSCKIDVISDELVNGERKLGFGSSAASAAAFVKAAVSAQEWASAVNDNDISEYTFKAHCDFQDKLGSGYDVYTSLSQGCNLFTGGKEKHISQVQLSWLNHLYVYINNNSVLSSGAVRKYERWKKEFKNQAFSYVNESNNLIRKLMKAIYFQSAIPLIIQYSELSRELGRAIGVHADFMLPPHISGDTAVCCKASGAGNECILLFSAGELSSDDPNFYKVKLYSGDGCA